MLQAHLAGDVLLELKRQLERMMERSPRELPCLLERRLLEREPKA